MKLYLLLLTVVILAYAGPIKTNIPVGLGFCRSPSIGPVLNTTEFFDKQWYTWAGFGNFFTRRRGGCSGIDSKVEDSTIHVLSFHYEPLLSQFISVKGETSNVFPRHEGLWFTVDYSIYGMFNVSIPYSILATDYNNWALIYSCHQLFGAKIERCWIITRSSSPKLEESQIADVETSLEKNGLKLEDFWKEDLTGCGQGEPRL